MRQLLTTVLLPLSLLAFLSGCAQATRPPTVLTKIERVAPPIPADRLACAPKPRPPVGVTMQSGVAAFLLEIDAWGDDCASRMAGLREMLRPAIPASARPTQ